MVAVLQTSVLSVKSVVCFIKLNQSAYYLRRKMKGVPMAKLPSSKKATEKSKVSPPRSLSVSGQQAKLDHVDEQLIRLLNERTELAVKIAELRKAAGEPAFSLGHDEQSIARALQMSKGPCPNGPCGPYSARRLAGRGASFGKCAWLSWARLQLQSPGGDPSFRAVGRVSAGGQHRRRV